MNALLRLLWALPLVLAVGAGVMILLRRFLVPGARDKRGTQRVVAREVLSLSEHTRVHLIEVDGGSYLIVESAQNATLQSVPGHSREASRVAVRPQPAWLRHFSGVTR